MSTTALVRNSDLVLRRFGSWPDFHDAEVKRIELDRAGPYMRVFLFAFSRSSEVDAGGNYIRQYPSEVIVRFDGIEDLTLSDFNHQNVVGRIELVASSPEELKVKIAGIFGIDAAFTCAGATVEAVNPCDEVP